jgi:hypothetical protein
VADAHAGVDRARGGFERDPACRKSGSRRLIAARVR